MVLDADTGRIMTSIQPDALRHPASLTKMMTLYLVFDALDSGALTLDQQLPVSMRAASQAPSKLGLRVGGTVSVEDAVLGLVTKSANDAAVVLAESLGRSPENFARMMTVKARSLGMTSTVYRNPNGLPDDAQVTTARDQARLGLALMRDHPHWYPYFSTRTFRYGAAELRNHNRLLIRYPGTDGIKTGYINASGFNLVASVKRDGRRVIGVIFGGRTGRERDDQMIGMLDQAFAALEGTPRPVVTLLADMPDKPGPRIATATAATPPGMPNPRPVTVARTTQATGDAIAALADEEPDEEDDPPAKVAVATPVPAPPAPAAAAPIARLATQSAPTEAAVAALAPIMPVPRPGTMAPVPQGLALPAPAPAAPEVADAAPGPLGSWAIQLGAFVGKSAAEAHVQRVRDKAPRLLAGSETRLEPGNNDGQLIWRARLAGFAESSARAACRQLRTMQIACVPVAPDRLALVAD
jgi:D-alanyl-D-alanine carboxypeptidase